MDGAWVAPAHAGYPFMSQEEASSPAKLAGELALRSSRAPHLVCPNHQHTVVVAISNVDVPLRVHVTSMWPVQSSSDCWPIVASTAAASSSDGRDHTSHRINKTNSVVLGVHDQQVAVVVTPDGLRCPPGGGESWTTITTVATLTSPGVG